MNRKIMQLAAFLLIFTLIPPILPAQAAGDGSDMLRVGLTHASGALPAANLENNTGYGAGYRFGYFDSSLSFVELARTDSSQTRISMLKSQNLWYGGSGYETTSNGGPLVGCYHIQVPGVYYNYADARNDAEIFNGFVAWIDGTYQVRVGSYASSQSAQSALAGMSFNGTVVGTSSYGITVVATGTNRILFQFDGGAGQHFGVMPDVTGAPAPRTWFAGYKYEGGFQYRRMSGGDVTVINVISLDDYTRGVAPYEMGRSWPLEALKAQATCARTYARIQLEVHKHNSKGYDICNTDDCQVYYGMGSNRSDWGPTEVSNQACAETAGMYIWYQGKLAETYYSSSHGGASEEIANVWTNNKAGDFPYLCGVIDPYEADLADSNSYSSWSKTYTKSQLTSRIQSKLGGSSPVKSFALTYSPTGNVISATIYYENGRSHVISGGEEVRSLFNLNSIHFVVNGATSGTPNPDVPETPDVPGNPGGTTGNYVISGNGQVTQQDSNPYIITGYGDVSPLNSRAADSRAGTVSTPTATTVTIGTSDKFVFTGGGWGHQLGMSQYGANAMARRGMTYEEIITFYFPGVNVARG